ncbi:MAG: rRNA maturation RNase YbeY [Bacilli bacterium]|nr:rRNA maturation RNase YbeY [Bacilli bacterium]
MFEIVNDTDREIIELNKLNEYIGYIVKKLKLEKCEFNIIIIDNKKIKNINKEYRNIDSETDVISFALEDNLDIKYDHFRLLGDIYISIDKCYSQAYEYGHSREREICFLATHGILHLLGYDHMNKIDEEEMFKLQNELLNSYNIKR